MTDRLEYCWYCKRPFPGYGKGWEHIGGTIGESHYVCTKEACRKKYERILAALKAAQELRKWSNR